MISCRQIFQYSRFVFKDGETPPAAAEAHDDDSERVAFSALQRIVGEHIRDAFSPYKDVVLGERQKVEDEIDTFARPLIIRGKQEGFLVEKYNRGFKFFSIKIRLSLGDGGTIDLEDCGDSTDDLLKAISIFKLNREKRKAVEAWEERFLKNKNVIRTRYLVGLPHYDNDDELASQDRLLFKNDREEVGKLVIHFAKGTKDINRVELLDRNGNTVKINGKTPGAGDLEKLTDEDLEKALALPEPRFEEEEKR